MASQLLVIVKVHPFTVVTSPRLFTVTALHTSDAVGGLNDGVPVQLSVALAPALPITGAVLSVTVMVCDTVAL